MSVLYCILDGINTSLKRLLSKTFNAKQLTIIETIVDMQIELIFNDSLIVIKPACKNLPMG